jgi:Tol biopolymer transport system component
VSASIAPLIPREVLLGNPKRSQPVISSDGARIAYLAPDEGDVLQIFVRALGLNDDRRVSGEPREIRSYQWAWDLAAILYSRDNEDDENSHICAIDLQTGKTGDLTPFCGHLSRWTAPEPGSRLPARRA